MTWELINCEARECVMDNSGYYTIIGYTGSGLVRCDIMKTVKGGSDELVMSFKGYCPDVRKYVIEYLTFGLPGNLEFSHEHASYIGEQLTLANEQKEAYVQE